MKTPAAIKTLNIFLTVTILVLLTAFTIPKTNGKNKSVTRWAVQKTSTLQIFGSSNVNTFGCDIQGYNQPDTLLCFNDVGGKAVPLKGVLEIDVAKFDCHNKMLTNDLRKTLKVNEYPTLIIRFLSLERFPKLCENKDYLKGIVEIELAGVCKKFDINYSFLKTNPASIELNGNRAFTFSDFNLKAPTKFAGLVKVKDRFDVNFKLLLNPLD